MSKKKNYKVAVTGGIGSGKSLFCKFLEKLNYPVIHADDLGKNILVKDNEVKREVISTFGNESYNGENLNRKYLAEKVFNDPENVLRINSIIHPRVIAETKKMMDEYLKENNIVFCEAALIYEADMEDLFDYVVLVTADEDIRMKRKRESDNMSDEDFIKRQDNQIPDKEKMKRADFIFINNGTTEELKLKVSLLLKILDA